MIKKIWVVKCDLCKEVDEVIVESMPLFGNIDNHTSFPYIDCGTKRWSTYTYSNSWQRLGNNRHLCPKCRKKNQIIQKFEEMSVEEVLQALGKEIDDE